MAEPDGTLTWDLPSLATALRVSEGTVREYFRDGRRVSFLIERRISAEVLGGTLAPSEGASYDLLDSMGRKWEVRSITKAGIYFCPSYMVGSGRKFDRGGFLAKLTEIVGFVVADVEEFPSVNYWKIPVTTIRTWWDRRDLGTTSKVSRKKALQLLRQM